MRRERARSKAYEIALFALCALPCGAQWIDYPTAGIPRTPDGKPNLAAPALRTADGKPDLSGFWDYERNRPCPPTGCPDAVIGQEFANIGWSIPGGLPFQPWAAQLVKQRSASFGPDDPHTTCLPTGPIRIHTAPMLRKIAQLPGLLIILSERNSHFRQIFTDGRPLPNDPQPAFNGYSVGKWEGDTLVVQTVGLSDQWLDHAGSPITESAKVTERYRRVNFGKLEIQVTVDDPKAYTKPWTITVNSIYKPDTELLDYTCLENERDMRHMAK